jgi:hypothetical protein
MAMWQYPYAGNQTYMMIILSYRLRVTVKGTCLIENYGDAFLKTKYMENGHGYYSAGTIRGGQEWMTQRLRALALN